MPDARPPSSSVRYQAKSQKPFAAFYIDGLRINPVPLALCRHAEWGRIGESTPWLSEPFGSPKDAETTLRQTERSNSARRGPSRRQYPEQESDNFLSGRERVCALMLDRRDAL